MNRLIGRFEVDELAGVREAMSVAGRLDGPAIRAAVRAIVKVHGRLLGEPWNAQAVHAEECVVEVIACQGLDAGRRWALALHDELLSQREVVGATDPAESCADPGLRR